MAKPQLKNSKVNLMHSLNSGHSYSASAWIQTADGPNMSDEDRKRAEYIANKLLEYGMRISIQFQEKVVDSFEKRGSMMLFPEDPNRQAGTFSKPSSGYQDPASQINVTPEEIEF